MILQRLDPVPRQLGCFEAHTSSTSQLRSCGSSPPLPMHQSHAHSGSPEPPGAAGLRPACCCCCCFGPKLPGGRGIHWLWGTVQSLDLRVTRTEAYVDMKYMGAVAPLARRQPATGGRATGDGKATCWPLLGLHPMLTSGPSGRTCSSLRPWGRPWPPCRGVAWQLSAWRSRKRRLPGAAVDA